MANKRNTEGRINDILFVQGYKKKSIKIHAQSFNNTKIDKLLKNTSKKDNIKSLLYSSGI